MFCSEYRYMEKVSGREKGCKSVFLEVFGGRQKQGCNSIFQKVYFKSENDCKCKEGFQ